MKKKLSQEDTIIKAMLENPKKISWKATDFQHGKYFVGYEATARMSEIAELYYPMVITGREGRFRTLSINWEEKEEIKYFKEKLNIR